MTESCEPLPGGAHCLFSRYTRLSSVPQFSRPEADNKPPWRCDWLERLTGRKRAYSHSPCTSSSRFTINLLLLHRSTQIELLHCCVLTDEFIHHDQVENSRHLILVGVSITGHQKLAVQETAMEEQLFLHAYRSRMCSKLTQTQRPEPQLRKGIFKPSLVDNAPVRVSEQIHFSFHLFSVLSSQHGLSWVMPVEMLQSSWQSPHLLVVGIQST